LDTSQLRNETTGLLRSASGLVDRNIFTDRQSSSSPEIDILPVVRRAKAVSDYGSDGGGAGFGGLKSLQCARSNADNRYDMGTVEPRVNQPSVHRFGSPDVGEDGELLCHKPIHVPAVITSSQSATVSGVKLIPSPVNKSVGHYCFQKLLSKNKSLG